jgi:hypothetical protein
METVAAGAVDGTAIANEHAARTTAVMDGRLECAAIRRRTPRMSAGIIFWLL